MNIIGSLLLFVGLFYFLDFGQIGEGFARISQESVVWASLLAAVALIIASIRWWLFVWAARFPHGFWVSVRVRLIAQLFNLLIPSGVVGDGLQVFLVSRRPRLSGPLALATILTDRLVALFSVMLVLIMTAWLLQDDMSGVVYGTLISGSIGVAIFVLAALASQKLRLLKQATGRLGKIIRFGLETVRAINSFRNVLQTLLLAFVFASVGILVNTAIGWVLISGMADVTYVQLIPTFCLVMLSAFVPATFSGMGVREWILYANLKDYGLSLEESVAISLALFGILICVAAALSAIVNSVSIYRGDTTSWAKTLFSGKRSEP